MEQQPLVVERTLNAPIARVWQALTDNDQMKQWYFQLPAFEARKGFEFSFNGQGSKGEAFKHNCRVTVAEPHKKLAYTWSYEGYPGESEVSFELFEAGEQTRVRITHTGLETFAHNGSDFSVESFTAGWNHILGVGLKEFVEGE